MPVCPITLQELRESIDLLPEGSERRLPQILARYADYFQLLPDQMVATYLAYETGLLDENGNLSKNKMKKEKQLHKKRGGKRGSEESDDADEPSEEHRLAAETGLAACAASLYKACFQVEDDELFEEWVKQVRIERQNQAEILKDMPGAVIEPPIIPRTQQNEHLSAPELGSVYGPYSHLAPSCFKIYFSFRTRANNIILKSR